MKCIKRLALPSLGLVLCGVGVILVHRSLDSSVAREATANERTVYSDFERYESSRSGIKNQYSSRILTERQEASLELKKKWKSFFAELGDVDLTGKQYVLGQALAEETVKALSCSVEMVELEDYLVRNYKNYGMDVVDGRLRSLLQDEIRKQLMQPETSSRMRSDLLKMPDNMETEKMRWAIAAGGGCREEEIYNFMDQLYDSGRELEIAHTGHLLVGRAALGYAAKMERDSSLKAISFLVRVLDEHGVSIHHQFVGPSLELKNFSDDMDFRRFQEQVMDPAHAKHSKYVSSSFNSIQDRFASAWAAARPEEAGAYFLERKDAYGDKIFQIITARALERDKVRGIEWALQLPAGLHRDFALKEIVRFLEESPSEAMVYAEEIQNPSMKRNAVEKLTLLQESKGR